MKLCKLSGLYLAVALFSTAALAANTVQTGTLKDLQTVGTTSKKQKVRSDFHDPDGRGLVQLRAVA